MGALNAMIGEVETRGRAGVDINGDTRIASIKEHGRSEVKLGADGR